MAGSGGCNCGLAAAATERGEGGKGRGGDRMGGYLPRNELCCSCNRGKGLSCSCDGQDGEKGKGGGWVDDC